MSNIQRYITSSGEVILNATPEALEAQYAYYVKASDHDAEVKRLQDCLNESTRTIESLRKAQAGDATTRDAQAEP